MNAKINSSPKFVGLKYYMTKWKKNLILRGDFNMDRQIILARNL